jgi:hypothetical protein
VQCIGGRGFRVDTTHPRQEQARIAGKGELCGAKGGHGCAASRRVRKSGRVQCARLVINIGDTAHLPSTPRNVHTARCDHKMRGVLVP